MLHGNELSLPTNTALSKGNDFHFYFPKSHSYPRGIGGVPPEG